MAAKQSDLDPQLAPSGPARLEEIALSDLDELIIDDLVVLEFEIHTKTYESRRFETLTGRVVELLEGLEQEIRAVVIEDSAGYRYRIHAGGGVEKIRQGPLDDGIGYGADLSVVREVVA